MKINGITADNFLRLNLFEADLSGATLHLFAGNNEAGKSSVQEAIRFALTGETVRVSKKGDYKLMIRDGAKAGTVSIDIDGSNITRDIKTAKLADDDRSPGLLPEYLPYLLNAQKFAHTNGPTRRAFLLELTGTSVEPDDIARRMKAKGVHENCIEKVKPLLRSSMDAGHKEAVDRAAEARAQWVGVTGRDRYGSQIAADWKPEAPVGFDEQALLDGEKGITQLQEAVDALNIKKGGIVSQLSEAKQAFHNQSQEGTFNKKAYAKLIKDKDAAQELVDQLQQLNQKDNDALNKVRERGVPVTCCECGGLLRVSFSGTNVEVEPFYEVAEDEQEKLQARITKRESDISALKAGLCQLYNDIGDMARLEAIELGGKVRITQADIDGWQEQLNLLDETLIDLTGKRAALDEKLAGLRAAAIQLRDAENITERAQSLHRAVIAWGKCVDALAPDGIPAEILSDTLKPVNDRLRITANATGWPQVSIGPTMDIEADGRVYQLLSESARWRADAAIADAISHLSGLGILILDRIDVLDIPSRGKLMEWMSTILDEYETILLFGTLKSLPRLPAGMAGHWIVNGELLEKE